MTLRDPVSSLRLCDTGTSWQVPLSLLLRVQKIQLLSLLLCEMDVYLAAVGDVFGSVLSCTVLFPHEMSWMRSGTSFYGFSWERIKDDTSEI